MNSASLSTKAFLASSVYLFLWFYCLCRSILKRKIWKIHEKKFSAFFMVRKFSKEFNFVVLLISSHYRAEFFFHLKCFTVSGLLKIVYAIPEFNLREQIYKRCVTTLQESKEISTILSRLIHQVFWFASLARHSAINYSESFESLILSFCRCVIRSMHYSIAEDEEKRDEIEIQ